MLIKTLSLRTAIRCLFILALVIGAAACGRNPQKLIGSGKNYLKEQKYSEAMIEFRNAVKADPNSAEAHYQLGRAYLAQGGYQEALQEFQHSLAINSYNHDAQLLTGNILLLQRKLDDARSKADSFFPANPMTSGLRSS